VSALRLLADPDATAALRARVFELLASVPDPEIPVLSVLDLGIIRHVDVRQDGSVDVGITPTYSGCPATPAIKSDVLRALAAAGIDATAVDVLAPAWSSDWLSEAGRRKLEAWGIAPPAHAVASPRALAQADPVVACPHCQSGATERLSEFGSTPCKALYRCTACLEPFDYFKCL
jgi:ring-1,2-phenylacetyl-CoA epoxidase subunit PaaD